MVDNLEQIRQSYASFDDFKIEHLAKNEAGGLSPDVIPILVEEISKRGLNPNLLKGIESQTKELTEDELNTLKSKIINLPCPDCGRQSSSLIGSVIRTVKSFVFFTWYTKKLIITCESCSKSRKKNAMVSTLLLGWWGIPFGVFKTPSSIIATWRDKKKQKEINETIVTSFVYNNIGELKTNWDNEKELVELVRHVNNNN